MRIRSSAVWQCILTLTLLPSAYHLMAQAGPQTGIIRGVIVDEGGGPIDGASVVADRLAPPTRFSQTTRSGPGSAFELQGLPPGIYRLCVQVPSADRLYFKWGATVGSSVMFDPGFGLQTHFTGCPVRESK